MRVSREQAEKNRANVVHVAGRMFRQRGFDGVGIAEIMKASGLTHGGFYGQFASKEQLVAEASGTAMSRTLRRWQTVLAEAAGAPMKAFAAFYLSPAHRDHPETGCVFATLASDAARAGPEVKAAFEAGIEDQLDLIREALVAQGMAPKAARTAAIASLSTLVGALVLSRAVNDPKLSGDILAAAGRSVSSVPDG